MDELVLINGLILKDPRNPVVTPHGMTTVRGGRFVSVDEPMPATPPPHALDLQDRLLMPGLVNAHTHAPMSLFRGVADDVPLKEWLEEYMFPLEAEFVSPDFVYLGARLSAAELAMSGVTTTADSYFFMERSAAAFAEMGLRAVIAQGVLDVPTPDAAAGHWMDRASEFLSEISGHPRITPALFCHSPYLCSQETFASAKRMCDSRGIRLYCHVAETAWEVTEMGARYGKTPVEFLKAAGVLDDSFTGVHAVHLTEKDMDMVAEAGASLVHCPEANLKQSSGAARPAQWLSKGIPTALGTDGPASNNNLDMIEEMRTATLVSKLFEGERDALNAADAVRAATYGSARALGLENRIAVIEAGREADFITIDFSGPHMTPMYDPLSHLVYCARASDVRDVYVAGACIVSEGRPVHPVLGALGEKIDEFKERIALRIGGSITKNRRRTLG